MSNNLNSTRHFFSIYCIQYNTPYKSNFTCLITPGSCCIFSSLSSDKQIPKMLHKIITHSILKLRQQNKYSKMMLENCV